MNKVILVAGATGDLGSKLCKELIKRGALVRAIVRAESNSASVSLLRGMGVEIIQAELSDVNSLVAACKGVCCVVSTLAGLHDVIVNAQSQLLQAAIKAGVPRFIPSDFCTDYTQLQIGDNRNFDLRKTFQSIIDQSDIRATSIFNGAFTHVLKYDIPLLNTKEQQIEYFTGKLHWRIDFTTVQDTAAYTAAAALDESTPRYLRIAGTQISPSELADVAKQLFGSNFYLKEWGAMEAFSAYISQVRQQQPEGEHELYPVWQQMQYLYSMFAAQHTIPDNDRYPGIDWQSIQSAFK
ncbi:NmrA family NAD(P)-binding protein [Chitinophaga rhizophila]|uniref:NmrA family NAD(P)-binding protein n=1 Tax=Chitinophaga rhizophila TaxID=2866212 RepID=A0ABS7GKT4_9BACT|nr:NmrA family NAD(P)-binding protein [Chitinophaga rhizophila]MBW8687901.1 NmrA family NAD(P)-binding protein [Chitinophaga rhizophila]